MRKKFDKIKQVKGELTLAGDKSISHRAVIFSAMAYGKSNIKNISLGEDVKSTQKIMEQLGAQIITNDNELNINGCGFKGFKNPELELNCGNSGTSARLIAGLLASQEFTSTLIGDESLSKRPMKRVIGPLKKMGTKFTSNENLTLPLTIKPNRRILPLKYKMPIASAQVKSAILIAGLHSDDDTVVVENFRTRNHTERMLGLPIKIIDENIISSSNKKYYPSANEYFIPGDISSAAFHIVLTLLTPNSELLLKDVSLNPTRIGFIEVLKKMGGQIIFEDIKSSSNEEYGNVIVKSSHLRNIEIDLEIISNIIDEIPILTIAGLFAEGDFVIKNATELRYKESDRINAVCSNLKSNGVDVEEFEDGYLINGTIKNLKPVFQSFNDHRIAMAFAILSMILENGGEVDGFECVNISNPQFNNQIAKIIS